VNPEEVERALRLILAPGQVCELRVLDASDSSTGRYPQTWSGYFNDAGQAAKSLAALSLAKGIYFTPNAVNPALLSRAKNRIRAVVKHPTTSDHDVIRRLWLLVDADPPRPTDISASDTEHDAAMALVRTMRDWLTVQGWPAPILADSGNGGHLMYRIDLPTDDLGLVQRCLEALAARFDDAVTKIDKTVFNPARIWKLYGTLACKGDSTDDRPHRFSKIIDVPDTLAVVSADLLKALAATVPSTESAQTKSAPRNGHSPTADGDDWLSTWIAKHNLDVRGTEPWQGGRRWVFNTCPWNSDHTNGSAFIIQQSSGAIGAGCHHSGCSGKRWYDLRDVVEPGWRERRTEPREGQDITSPRELPLAFTESAWPDPPDERVYHGLAGEFMRMIDPHTEADPIAVLIQFLLAVGNVIGRHAHAVADGASHYANLFACLVGSTSKGRKGSAFTHVKNLLSQLDPTWSTDHVLGGLSSGEGLIWAIRDPITKTEAIKNKKTGEITAYQQVVVDEGIADKRLFVIESEFARVITAMSRERNTLSMVLRDAWDTGNLRTITKNSPAVATAGHVSVMGHVTRDELRQQLAVCDQTNGFANRFLWLCVRRSKALPEGGQAHRLNMANIVEALRSVIEFARDVGEMGRDDEARGTWADVYPILSDGKPGMLGAVTARAEAQVLRLAMLYAVLDRSVVVRNQHLLAALSLWDYCEQSARFIFGGSVGNRTADVILAALKPAPDGLSRTDLRDLFGRNRGAEDIVFALNTLQGLGLVECIRQPTKGHPIEIWRCTVEGTT
jgi:hypothetical protein